MWSMAICQYEACQLPESRIAVAKGLLGKPCYLAPSSSWAGPLCWASSGWSLQPHLMPRSVVCLCWQWTLEVCSRNMLLKTLGIWDLSVRVLDSSIRVLAKALRSIPSTPQKNPKSLSLIHCPFPVVDSAPANLTKVNRSCTEVSKSFPSGKCLSPMCGVNLGTCQVC